MTTPPAAPPTGRSFPLGKLILGFLAGLALTLAFGAGALLAYQGQYADRVYPGVSVDGVDVSGLAREAAIARLEDRLAGYAEGAAVIAIDGSEVRIPYAALGRRADVDALVELAWSVGRDGGDPLGRAAQGVRSLLDGTHIDPLVVLDPAAVARVVTEAALGINRAPVSGSATVTETGFVASPAVPGKVLPSTEITAALLARLADPAAPGTLELAYQPVAVEPYIDDAEVAGAIASANRMAADVVLTSGKETWTIKGATVRSWIAFETTPMVPPTVALTAPKKALANLAKKIDTAPMALLRLQAQRSVGVVAGRNGRATRRRRRWSPRRSSTAPPTASPRRSPSMKASSRSSRRRNRRRPAPAPGSTGSRTRGQRAQRLQQQHHDPARDIDGTSSRRVRCSTSGSPSGP
jgi:hypothetical protein